MLEPAREPTLGGDASTWLCGEKSWTKLSSGQFSSWAPLPPVHLLGPQRNRTDGRHPGSNLGAPGLPLLTSVGRTGGPDVTARAGVQGSVLG